MWKTYVEKIALSTYFYIQKPAILRCFIKFSPFLFKTYDFFYFERWKTGEKVWEKRVEMRKNKKFSPKSPNFENGDKMIEIFYDLDYNI